MKKPAKEKNPHCIKQKSTNLMGMYICKYFKNDFPSILDFKERIVCLVSFHSIPKSGMVDPGSNQMQF